MSSEKRYVMEELLGRKIDNEFDSDEELRKVIEHKNRNTDDLKS